MERHRISLATLMAVVLVAAIELAVVRAFLPLLEEMVYVFALSGLALQSALNRLIQGRGRGRVFWAGFVAAGSLALMTYIWEESAPNNNTSFGSPWFDFMFQIDDVVPALSIRTPPRGWSAARLGVNAVVLVLPQLLIALAGGLLFRGIAGRRSLAFAIDLADWLDDVPGDMPAERETRDRAGADALERVERLTREGEADREMRPGDGEHEIGRR